MNEVQWRIEVLVTRYEAASYGPAHAVFDDGNYDDDSIRAALNRIKHYDPEDYAAEYGAQELDETKRLLEWMLTVPEGERDKAAETWVLFGYGYVCALFLNEADAKAWNARYDNQFALERVPPRSAYFYDPSFEVNQTAIYRQCQEESDE